MLNYISWINQIPNPSITNVKSKQFWFLNVLLCQHLDYKIEAAHFPAEMIKATTVNKTLKLLHTGRRIDDDIIFLLLKDSGPHDLYVPKTFHAQLDDLV